MEDDSSTGDQAPAIPQRPSIPAAELAPELRPKETLYATAASYSGPFPPPQMLQEYERIEGALAQIFRFAEKQQDHSHAIDREELAIARLQAEGAIADAKAGRSQAARGQLLSLVFCLASIVAGLLIALLVDSVWAPWAGGLVTLGAPATIVTLLITGRHPNDAKQQRPLPSEDSR